MVKINKLSIENIGPIKKLDLEFDSHFNIICGQNGIGKTTILDCLAQSFSINQSSIKRKAGTEQGSWVINVAIDNSPQERRFTTSSFHPNESERTNQGFYNSALDTIVFRTHRDIPYQKLSSLSSDPQKDLHTFSNETIQGSLSHDLKNWFVNRHLWSKHDDHLDENQLRNIALAKECFSLLNPDIIFSKVSPNTNDILLRTSAGEIYFEYLSSGYKSCIAVLVGLIKEIEFRYKSPSKYVKDFNGIVFIDELDLHLHPEWQAKIYTSLKAILPNAQIFTSTHSPHIIQVAEPNEIIPLTLNDANDVAFNNVLNKQFGFQGWTVEEILVDVMGMTETRTPAYLALINGFNSALENENYVEGKEYLSILDQMLHPENALKKILKIQLIGISDND